MLNIFSPSSGGLGAYTPCGVDLQEEEV